MNIPDEAVEAAFRSIVGGNEVTGPDIAGDFLTTEQIIAILEAAAPHLMAAALTSLADYFDELGSLSSYSASEAITETWLAAATFARSQALHALDSAGAGE